MSVDLGGKMIRNSDKIIEGDTIIELGDWKNHTYFMTVKELMDTPHYNGKYILLALTQKRVNSRSSFLSPRRNLKKWNLSPKQGLLQ